MELDIPERDHLVVNFGRSINQCGVMDAPEVARHKKFARNFRGFWKTTPYGKIVKILFRKFSSRHRSTCCVQISWNLADGKLVKYCVIYQTKKTKFRMSLKLSILRGWHPKSARASPQQCTECFRFHPNRFHFRRSYRLAERVNTAKTRRKVNPIFGSKASYASSRIKSPWLVTVARICDVVT